MIGARIIQVVAFTPPPKLVLRVVARVGARRAYLR